MERAFMCEMYASEYILASNFECVVKPDNLFVISSNAAALWCLWIMALLRSFGSRHTLRVPLALQGYVSELTQGVSLTCWVMSCTVISLSQVSVSSLASMRTLHFPWCTGVMLRSNSMEYSPDILPSLSKESRNMSFRSLMCWMVLWSCNWETIAVWFVKRVYC